MANYYNPFQGQDLFLPKQRKDDIDAVIERQDERDYDRKPFSRTIDVWYLSLLLAVKLELKGVPDPKKSGWKFIDGSIFKGDMERIHQLEVFGIAWSEDPYIVKKPEKILRIANGLAAAGVPELLSLCSDGTEVPLWSISQALEAFLPDS